MTATEPTHNTLRVRPVGGARVLDPVTFRAVPEAGRTVPNTSYWRRRLGEGLLEEIPAVKATEATETTEATEPAKPKKGAKA